MSQSVGKGPRELADALFFITSAGLEGEQALRALEAAAKGSAIGLGDTATVADALTSAMNAYGAETLSAEMATAILVATVREGKVEADQLAGSLGKIIPIASEMGVSFDQVGAAIAAMTRLGLDANVSTTGLRALFSGLLQDSPKVRKGLAGALCPDHYFVSNVEECVQWGLMEKVDVLVSESAGLCNRCSPHIREIMAVCVIDNLSGINTPKKIGPMLKAADVVVITKGDIVSQAEREVFAARVHMVNSKARILHVNGITGQGSFELSTVWTEVEDTATVEGKRLRFSMPAALCSYCLGETRIGSDFQMGNVRKMDLEMPTGVKTDGGPSNLGSDT